MSQTLKQKLGENLINETNTKNLKGHNNKNSILISYVGSRKKGDSKLIINKKTSNTKIKKINNEEKETYRF